MTESECADQPHQTNSRQQPQRKEASRMLILKRLAVWFVESSSEVLLLGLVLCVLLGHDKHAFFKDLLIYSSGIILLFFTSGYLLSTIVVRAIWSGRTLWSYPAIATVLFFIHFEIMNVAVGGAFEPAVRFRIRAADACIVFACTLAGTFALRKWHLHGSSPQTYPLQSTNVRVSLINAANRTSEIQRNHLMSGLATTQELATIPGNVMAAIVL